MWVGEQTRCLIRESDCLRQLMSDFNLTRVLEAIKVIAITVIELGADWRAAEAWLHRLFCVVEGFATVNAKGKLLLVLSLLGVLGHASSAYGLGETRLFTAALT